MCPKYVQKFRHIMDTWMQMVMVFTCGDSSQVYMYSFQNGPNFKICVQNVSQICLKIWTHFGHLDFNGHDKEFSPKCYGRSHLAPAGNTCYMLVTYWTKLRTLVGHIWSGTNCDQIVPGVTICYHVWPSVTMCDQHLPRYIYYMWLGGSRCEQMLQWVTSWF